jgi:hypothetical protein
MQSRFHQFMCLPHVHRESDAESNFTALWLHPGVSSRFIMANTIGMAQSGSVGGTAIILVDRKISGS